MATILTLASNVPNGAPGCRTPTNDWTLDTYLVTLTAGGRPQRVSHLETAQAAYPGSASGFKNVVLVGWDAGGPLAVVGADFSVQDNPWVGTRVVSGQLTRIGLDGSIGVSLAGRGCTPYSGPVASRVICLPGGPSVAEPTVRDYAGSVLWTDTSPKSQAALPPIGAISPDGSQLATEGRVVQLAGGATSSLPSACYPSGWIDPTTIVCGGASGSDLGVVHLADPNTLTDLRFTAEFVGRIATS